MRRVRCLAPLVGAFLGLILGLPVAVTAHAAETARSQNGFVATAHADKNTDVPAPTQTQMRQHSPILLSVYSDTPDVTPELIRAALEREIGSEVQLRIAAPADPSATSIVVAYHPSRHELAVSLTQPGRANTTRIVEAPKASEEAVNVAALLAASLARTALEQREETKPSAPPEQAAHSGASTPDSAVAQASASSSETERQAASAAVESQQLPASGTSVDETFATASFIYPLSTNYAKPDIRTHLSFNLIYGHVGGVDGLELGLANTASSTGRGVQAGALVNWVLGDFTGLELAGVFNSTRALNGLQFAFGANYVQQRRMGGQIAGIANLAGANAVGVALTFGLNSARSGGGLSLAGVANVNRGSYDGLAIAPFNWAGDVSGVQVGIVNVGRKIRGVQLGLINIADDVEGVPIGLVSVTRSGGLHPMVWSSTATLGNVGLKFATRYTYTFVHVSAKPNGDRSRIGPGLGFGASAPLLPKTFFEPDLGATHLIGNTSCCETGFFGAVERRRDETLFRLRASLRYEFAKHLSVIGGGGVVGRLTYPLDDQGNTEVKVSGLIEGFGGVEL